MSKYKVGDNIKYRWNGKDDDIQESTIIEIMGPEDDTIYFVTGTDNIDNPTAYFVHETWIIETTKETTMTITREDAELIAAAMGCTITKDDGGYTLWAPNGEFWQLDSATIFDHYILDLAKRAGPKPRSEEEEAEMIAAHLNLAHHRHEHYWVFEQFNCGIDLVTRMELQFDYPIWNKLLKLAKEAKIENR